MFAPEDLFDLDHTAHRALFEPDQPAWLALAKIGDYLAARLAGHDDSLLNGDIDDRAIIGPEVYIGPGTVVEANAVIQGPAWVGKNSVIRSGAYLRENVIAGNSVVMGNSSEFKNCLIFDDCEVPHFNYVGDSILGHRAHLGAGVICSNVRLDRAHVAVRTETGDKIDTGLEKFGALIGDRTEIGCNSVLSPGSILGRDCIVHPCTHWRGVLSDSKIVKNTAAIEVVERK